MSTEPRLRPPGRRDERRRRRREAIVALATRCFLDKGYAGTTMSSIAAELGGSKGTLWRYFGSKEALFAAVIDDAVESFRAQLATILDPCEDMASTLRRFCLGYLDKVTSPEAVALHRLVVAEAGRSPEMGRIFYERAPRLTQATLSNYLEGMMDRGLLRRGDALTAARALIGLCLAGCHQQLLMGVIERGSRQAIEADIDAALDLFLSGLDAGR